MNTKILFFCFFIAACLISSGCSGFKNNVYHGIYEGMDKHIAEYEEKLAASQTPLEEAKNRAILGDFYRIKGQTLLVSRPEQEEEAMGWIEKSTQMYQHIMANFPNEYESDEFVRNKTSLGMASNLYLIGAAVDEVDAYCQHLTQSIECPDVLPELKETK